IAAGEPAKLVVNEREKLAEGVLVAPVPADEQLGHFSGTGLVHDPSVQWQSAPNHSHAGYVLTTRVAGATNEDGSKHGKSSALSLFAAFCALSGARRGQKHGAPNWRSEYVAKKDESYLALSSFVFGSIRRGRLGRRASSQSLSPASVWRVFGM